MSMFEKKSAAPTQCISHSETIIAAGTVVVGDIQFAGGLRIEGEVRGDVRSRDGAAATLVIGETGHLAGDATVARIVVHGHATGRLDAAQSILLHVTARVDGDISYAAAEINAGALIHGQLLPWQPAVQPVELVVVGQPPTPESIVAFRSA